MLSLHWRGWLLRVAVIYSCLVKPLAEEDLEHVLAHTLPLWDGARGGSLFLSGGTGFFGAWLLESLAYANRRLSLNLSATVLSRNPAAFAAKLPHIAADGAFRLLQGDVRNFTFPEQDFDFIIHGAASTTAAASHQPIELLSTLLDGTKRMLALARARGTKKFLFVSSGAVYGRQPEHLSHIPEDYLGGPDWLDPNAVYGEGKRVAEQMCSLDARESNVEFAIARCFAFVGPHLPLNQHFAIGNFIGDALAARNIAIQGDGTPLRSYLYAADLAIWLWTLLFCGSQGRPGPLAVNVGSAEAISIRDLAQMVVDELNPSLKVEIAQKPVPGAALMQYVPAVQRAEACLGLRQTISLREAIRRTAAWHR